MEENEKYKIEEDYSIPELSSAFNLRSIKNVSAVVDKIEIDKRTRRKMNDNGSSDRGIPYVDVYFDTGYKKLKKRYCMDPFVDSEIIDDITNPMLGSLVSTANARWDKLPELIGSEVQLKSDGGSNRFRLQNHREPRDYPILMEAEAESLRHDKIDSIIPEMLTRQVTNMKIGRGNIVNISADENKSTVSIELNSGHTFSSSFKLKEDSKERESTNVSLGISFNTSPEYTFWDFTKDALGYIPDKENYEHLLGVDVPVEYVLREWYVSYELN